MTWVFLMLGGLYIASRAFGPLGPIAYVYGIPGSLFWLWLSVLAFAQAIYNRKASPWVRLTALAITVATLTFPSSRDATGCRAGCQR